MNTSETQQARVGRPKTKTDEELKEYKKLYNLKYHNISVQAKKKLQELTTVTATPPATPIRQHPNLIEALNYEYGGLSDLQINKILEYIKNIVSEEHTLTENININVPANAEVQTIEVIETIEPLPVVETIKKTKPTDISIPERPNFITQIPNDLKILNYKIVAKLEKSKYWSAQVSLGRKYLFKAKTIEDAINKAYEHHNAQ